MISRSLDDDARARLLDAARAAIAAALGEGDAPSLAADGPLGASLGVFVTVRRGAVLRGCRGILETDAPLCRTVPELARLSAFADPRFHPFERVELEELEVEISVLHDRRPVDGPGDLVLGTDGVYLTVGKRRGFLLPQVAEDHGFDAEGFLDAVCLKAGVAPGRWRAPEARLEAFEVEHFS